MGEIETEDFNNDKEAKLEKLILKELNISEKPLEVTELTRRTIKDPTWNDRELVQKALADLLLDGDIAQTPEWEYTITS